MTQIDKLISQAVDLRREQEKHKLKYYAAIHKIGERADKVNLINHIFDFSYPTLGITKFLVETNHKGYNIKVLSGSQWTSLSLFPNPFDFINELLKEIK